MKKLITIPSKFLLLLVVVFGLLTSSTLTAKTYASETLQQQIEVSGTVTDAQTGDPLPGVNIVIQGTTQGTTTDMDGEYSIEAPADATLVFSFVGYQEQTVEISGQQEIDVAMEQAVTELEEVVAIGYGQQRKKDLTGAVASIDAEEIDNQSAASFDNLLKGRSAGVQISSSSGMPGAGTYISIRGASSINAGTQPLLVIDGMPIYNDNKDAPGTQYGTTPSTNALTSLNPNDIESIEILKDASATAIYGSRGSNGVILIDTKSGKGATTSITYDAYYGVQSVAKKLDLMNGEEHARFLNDWAVGNGLAEPFTNPESIGEGTDWQEEIYRNAPIQNHQLSISKGSGNTRYYISGNYYNQQGIVLNSQLERYSLRANIDYELSDKLNFNQSLTVNRTINDGVPTSSVGAGNVRAAADKAIAASPTIPVYDENGNYVRNWYAGWKEENPVAALKNLTNQIKGDNLIGNLSLDYAVFEGLTLKTSLGINLMNRKHVEYYPMQYTYIGRILDGLGIRSNREIINVLNENTIRYTRTYNNLHEFEVLGGVTWQTEKDESSFLQPSGFPNDRMGVNAVEIATTTPVIGSNITEWSIASGLGRINYKYDDKYLLTVTFRADGSSKFGEGNKWGYFPSAAVGYRISEENFIQNLNLFDDLKIRGSYGFTGNQEIGSYNSLARVVTGDIYIIDNTLVSGSHQASLSNEELKWEKTEQWDIGIDASLFDNRLTLGFDYYLKDTEDLLFWVNLPSNSGYSGALDNTGRVENKGFEFEISADILQGNFNWSIDGNYSHNRRKLISLGRSASTTLFEGYTPGVVLGYKYEGVFHNQDEVNSQSAQGSVEPGDAKYRDINEDGVLDAEDRTIIGTPNPDFIFGFTNHFSYKGVTLRIFLQGQIGEEEFKNSYMHNPAEPVTNKSRDLVDRWTPTNKNSNIPKAGFNNWRYPSTYMLQDASFIKIRNIQLGYNIPLDATNWLDNARIYLSGENLFTFTKDYSGYDPDVGMGYPSARNVMLGINVEF